MSDDQPIEELERRHKSLTERRDELQRGKDKVEAELSAHKRSLKALMDKARKEGFDPDNLQEEVRKLTRVVSVKQDTFEAELTTAEKILRPMLQEIVK
jgi:septal ring factor EnvC (AmiA/AmiB activator)